MTNSSEQYSPFEKLKWLAAKELAEHFPNYHNALLGGRNSKTYNKFLETAE